jgi:hypothetical protein
MDLNVRAFKVVQAAIQERPAVPPDPKKASSRKGGLKGGPSRARSISRERRIEIAKKANQARWSKTNARGGK